MKNTLEKISKFGLKLLVPLTAKESYPLIVQEALKLVGGEYGSIVIKEGEEFKRVYTTSPIPYHSKVRQRAYSFRAYTQKEVLVVPASRTVKAHPELAVLGIKCTVLIPLSYKNKSLGVLIINSKKEQFFGKSELVTLKLFGSMVSLAIRKAQLYEETKSALETRDLFISMAAHELKTPITTIYGYSQLLLDNQKQGKPIKGGWLGSLNVESYRLTLLINDLLEINHIRSGTLHYILKECSLKEIINRTIDNFKFRYPNREIVLEDSIKDSRALLVCDFDKMMQVFTNLLNNAAKFSPYGSKITLCLKESDITFIIKVKDQGRGISEKDLPRVFEGYYKGQGTAHAGLGLGLYLAKSIVEHHRGFISLQSKVDKGTQVEVQLPKIKMRV